MRLALTDDQLAIRDLCRSLFSERRDPDELWERCVELGLSTALVPADDGGLGLGWGDAVVIAEEAGRSLVPVPLASTLGLVAVARSASLQGTLRAVAAGATGAVLAGGPFVEEPSAARPALDARAGCPLGLTLAGDARGALTALAVICRSDGLSALPAIDAARPLCLVNLTAADLQDAERGPVTAPEWLALPSLVRSAEALGTVGLMLEMAVEHAKQRRQFGQPIGSFQAVKHRLVDAELAVERARSLLYGAVATRDRSETADFGRAVPVRATADAALEAARTAVHVHGATGITVEHPVSGLYARARQLVSLLRHEAPSAAAPGPSSI